MPTPDLWAFCDAPERFGSRRRAECGQGTASPGRGRCVLVALVQARVSFVGNKNYCEEPIANLLSRPFPFINMHLLYRLGFFFFKFEDEDHLARVSL